MEKQQFLNFGLRFNLRQTRENKPTIIYAVFVCNGIQHKVNTMLKVYPEHWDNKAQTATVSNRLSKLDNRNNLIANKKIVAIHESFKQKIAYLCNQDNHEDLSNEIADAINPNLKHRRKSMTTNKMKIEIVLSDIAYKYQTAKTYEQSLFNIRKFIKFLEEKDINDDISSLNGKLLNDYQDYLIENDLQIRSIGRYISGIKTLVNYLNKDKDSNIRIDLSAHIILKDKRTTEQKKSKNVPLSESQLLDIYNLTDLSSKEEEARDLFICQSLLGQRISDMPKIFKGDYTTNHHENGLETISFNVQKTGEEATLFLFPIAKNIISKYCTKQFQYFNLFETDEKKIVNNEMAINATIKEVCKKAGLTAEINFTIQVGDKIKSERKPLYQLMHTHIARHTFITIMCKRGIPKETVIIATAHTDVKMIDEVYLHETASDKGAKLIEALQKNSGNSSLFSISKTDCDKLLTDLFAYDKLLMLKEADESCINIEELEECKDVIKTIRQIPSIKIPTNIDKSEVDEKIGKVFPTLLLFADRASLILFIQKIAGSGISNQITDSTKNDLIHDLQALDNERQFSKKLLDIWQEEQTKKGFINKLTGQKDDRTLTLGEVFKEAKEIALRKDNKKGQ
jgi:site-specific recombinase XerD